MTPDANRAVDAVLFDRDGTLVVDVPYNADPAAVEPVNGARDALDRLRDAGIAVGIVSNQSGIARGLFDTDAAEAVFARVAELLGPFGAVEYCPHDDDDGCACRKPNPGLVLRAAERLAVAPERCAVVGDIAADMYAARAAGALAILVPNERTRRDEITTADICARDLAEVADLILDHWARPEPDAVHA